jgi:hypothetical protein
LACIYSKSEEVCESREHVLPAFIGGMKKLPLGYVSDKVNNIFSKMEDYLAHYSHIGFIRSILGPGKRGKNNFYSRPMIGQTEENKSILVQGTKTGASVMPQLIIRMNDNEYSTYVFMQTSNNVELVKGAKKLINDFFLLNLDEPVTFIEDLFAEKNRVLVTQFKGRWYLSSKNKYSVEELRAMLDKRKHFDENPEKLTIPNEIQVGKSFTATDYLFRVHAKMALNFLAYHYGHQYINNDDFESIIEFVLYGKGELNQNVFNGVFDSKRLYRDLHLDENSHMIVVYSDDNYLNALICLYGNQILNFRLIESTKTLDKTFIVYSCDWKNRNEDVRINNYISKKMYLVPHDKFNKKDSGLNIYNSGRIFSLPLQENVYAKFKSLFTQLKHEGFDIEFYFDSRVKNQYSTYSNQNKKINIYINYFLNHDLFNLVLLQTILYCKVDIETLIYVNPKLLTNSGESAIAGYINQITSFTLIDKKLQNDGVEVDFFYDNRFINIVNDILKHKKEKSFNDFLLVRLSLQIAITSYIYSDYMRQFEVLLSGIIYQKSIMSNVKIIHKFIQKCDLHSKESRFKAMNEIINILKIGDHVSISNKLSKMTIT